MANAFSLTGALGGAVNTAKNAINGYINPTPAAKTYPPVTIPPATSNFSNANSTSSGVTPSTAVKKITQPNGVTTEYHAPATPAKTSGVLNSKPATPAKSSAQAVPTYGSTVTDSAGRSGAAMFDPNTGKPLVNPAEQTQTPPTQSYNPAPQTYNPQPTYTPENTTYGGLISEAANRSTQAGKDYTDAQEEAKRISDQQTALAQDFAQKNQNIAGTAGFLTQETGLQGQLANKYNTVQGALSSQYNAATNRLGAANTQQGLQQGLLTSAMGAKAPVNQFGQLTDPTTGSPINGGDYTDNPQLMSAVDKAVQIALQSGPNDPSVQALLSTFGMPGQQAFTSAMQKATNNTYNPGMIAANAEFNRNTAKAFAEQGTTIGAASRNIASAGQQAVDLLTQAGLNTREANWANEKINSFVTEQSNPVAYKSLTLLNNEVKKFMSTIAGANTNLIDTEVTRQMQNYDIMSMTKLQIDQLLTNVNKIAGEQQANAQYQQGKASEAGATSMYSGGQPGANSLNMGGGINSPSSAVSNLLFSGGAALGTGAGAIKAGAGEYLSKVFNLFK